MINDIQILICTVGEFFEIVRVVRISLSLFVFTLDSLLVNAIGTLKKIIEAEKFGIRDIFIGLASEFVRFFRV